MATAKTAVTEGSGVNVATYSFSEDALTKQVQRVVLNDSAGNEALLGSTTLANGQAAPTSTAATLVAARTGRQRVTFRNIGAVTVYIGIATVTVANGMPLYPGDSITLATAALVQAITASGTGSVSYIEEF